MSQRFHDFLEGHRNTDFISVENLDPQFISMQRSRDNVLLKYGKSDFNEEVFIKLIVINALITYQIGGTGESRWTEFFNYTYNSFDSLIQGGLYDINRRNQLMLDSKYNKRLREMKLDRIRKIIPHIKDINLTQLKVFSDDLLSFNKFIADSMKQKIFAKTIVMAVKFFGYANRVVYMRSDNFPMDIDIPLDSRIERIFLEEFGDGNKKNSAYIIKFFRDISLQYGIPPLHLDSILWLEYRYIFYHK